MKTIPLKNPSLKREGFFSFAPKANLPAEILKGPSLVYVCFAKT
jgi:hypothetical protein